MEIRTSRLLRGLLWSILALTLTLGFLALVKPDQVSGLMMIASLDRDLEPITLKGVYSGVPVDQLFVYREVGGAWEQMPFQIDEVTSSGDYTGTEDGLMDSNDEVVFMAQDLGDKATTSITGTLPISSAFFEVEVTDPLSPAKKGWAYIVRSSTLVPNSGVDYVDYVAANRRINATDYSIGWAASHIGMDYMSLFGGADILDRTKLRVEYSLFNFPLPPLTEDSTLLTPPPDVVRIKDGPVRVIAKRGAATTLAYSSLLYTTTPIDLTALPASVVINEGRISTDLVSTITGTYYDENVPGGVTIDGNPIPDSVPATLSQAWRQTSLNSGTVIQVINLLGLPGSSLRHYYKDDSSSDPNDTGDSMSYGDSGFAVVNPASKTFTFESVQYFLPGMQTNRGAEFYNFFQSQLDVTLTFHFDGQYKVYLPLILNRS